MAEPEIATLEEILSAGTILVDLPNLSRTAGTPRKLRARKISSDEYMSLLPEHPPEAADWPKENPDDDEATREKARKAFQERELAWLRSLPQEERDRRGAAFADVDYRLVALASLAPKLTVDDARHLGEDANIAAQKILEFSLPKDKAKAKKADAA